jgi:hypothetical protein
MEPEAAIQTCIGGRVVLSTDHEITWSTLSLKSEVPNTATTLGFPGFTGNVLWATNTDVYVTSVGLLSGTHLVRSNQGGASGTWTAAQNGLPDVAVEILKADPSDPSRKTIFAGTDL